MIRVLMLLLALFSGNAWSAPLPVVATSTSMAAVVRAVGGDRVAVTVLATPEQDLHRLQVKPSMMRALRTAALVVAVGAELEVGWLPPALSHAANPALQPGRPGYFEAAAQVPLLDVGTPADRALGDVHPLGNPHVTLDPVRMSTIATALAERLALLDPPGAADYRQGAADFARAVAERLPRWRAALANAPGAVLYHRDALYLLDRFGVPLLGTIEPIPGVPPHGAHLARLRAELSGRAGVIIHTPFQDGRTAQALGAALGWPVIALPLDPPLAADGSGYLIHLERWITALAGHGK